MPRRSAATVRRLERSMGTLATAAIARMDEVLPWYRAMPAENRSWVNLVAQAGIAAFVEWFRQPDAPQAISADVFGTAPRELTRTVTLQQTVELVRVVIEVVEEQIEQIAPGDEAVRARGGAALLPRDRLRRRPGLRRGRRGPRRLGRPAGGAGRRRAAARRGRRRAAVPGRRAGLGQPRLRWSSWWGSTPDAEPEAVVDEIRRAARAAAPRRAHRRPGRPAGRRPRRQRATRCAPPGTWSRSSAPARSWSARSCADLLAAGESAAAALAGLRAAPAWPDAPRPVPADDLLPERALAGDAAGPRAARATRSTGRCVDAGAALLETLSASSSRPPRWRRTARVLFVHPNTVRYRLRRVAEVTGYAPTGPAAGLHAAGRADPAAGSPTPDCVTRAFVGFLQSRAGSLVRLRTPASRSRPEGGQVLVIVAPGQGAQTPGFLTPWLELPGLRGPAALAVRLRRPRPRALRHRAADAETIRDTAVAQPLLVAAGLVSRARALPAPGRRVPRRSARPPGTASARSPPPPAPA